ncbi:MAG: fibronectin type III domain-containing protein, partial [Acidimicrobiia bacterium]|nr:fibronectin type III domain-containing protein [Acidimicrobiia bacterium]
LDALAAEYFVTLVPGFDFPGHATAISEHFKIGTGDNFGDGTPCGQAHTHAWLTPGFATDLIAPKAINRVHHIIQKFAAWFSSPYVHVGADEVPHQLANCGRYSSYIAATSDVGNFTDLEIKFANAMNEVVRSLGKTTMMYGDVTAYNSRFQTLNTNIVIHVWNTGRPAGYKIIHNPTRPTYLTPNYHNNLFPNDAQLYDRWTPSSTDLGSAIAIWSDAISTGEDEYYERFLRRSRAVMADRTWNATATPDTVTDFYGRINNIGTPPGFVGYRAPPRVNDGKPSHHYKFTAEKWGDFFGHLIFPDINRRRGLMTRDVIGGLHAWAGGQAKPEPDTTDAIDGSSFLFVNGANNRNNLGTYNAGRQKLDIGGVPIEAPWTMSVWVKRLGNTNNATLLTSREPRPGATGLREWHIRLQQGSQNRVGFTTPQGTTHTFNYAAPVNTWAHLTLVADAASTKLYVNGSFTDTIATSTRLPFGAFTGNQNAANAKLDELKIWDEALTAAQVAALPRAHCTNTGLIHHWTFDEPTGNTATDAGSGAKNGAITGATRVTAGRLGGALSFDGTNDYVQVEADTLGTGGCGGGWTTALWVKRTDSNPEAVLFSPVAGSSVRARVKLEQWRDTNEVGLTRTGGGGGDYDFGYTAPLNTWTHLTIVGTSSDTKLYANGTLAGTINQAFSLPLHRIGAESNGDASIDADLDDIRVFGHAKTATEVTALYSQVNLGPPDAPTEVRLTPAAQQLTVTWIPPANNGGADITSYLVSHKLASAGADAWSTPVSVAAPTVTAVISSLTNASVYEVRVAARNSAGQGAWSEVVSAAPSASVVAPGAPRDVSAVPGDASLVVSWAPPSADGGAVVSGYLIQHREDTQGAAWSTPAA